MMTATQKADRLALIKEIAERRNAAASFRKKLSAKSSKVRRYTDVVEKPKRQAKYADFDNAIAKLDENHNQWTDASKYANEYYGDTYRATTKFDNDWN